MQLDWKKLLVPIDFSDVTDRVVAKAEQMARALGAEVLLMNVASNRQTIAGIGEVPFVMTTPEVAASERFPEQKRQLAMLKSALHDKGIDAQSLFVAGSPAEEILAAADQHQVELIIMGSHGHGAFYELVVGTVTQSVLHHTCHAVLIVPSETYKEMKTVAAEQWTEPMATPY